MRTLSSTYESIEGDGCIAWNFAFIDISVSSGAHFARTFSALEALKENKKVDETYKKSTRLHIKYRYLFQKTKSLHIHKKWKQVKT